MPEVVAKDIDDDVGSNKLVMKLVKNGVQWWDEEEELHLKI